MHFHWSDKWTNSPQVQIHSLNNPPRRDKQLDCAKRTGRNLMTEQNPLTLRCAPQDPEGMPWSLEIS